MSRSSYVEPTALGLVLAALQPTNRLVFEVMLATGLRVGDVLKLTTEQVKRQRFTVRESKTGKTRRVYLPAKLQLQLLAQAGRLYAFEGRTDWRKLNHDPAHMATTLVYALSDQLNADELRALGRKST